MNSYQVEYLGVWMVAFAQFLGWTDAQIFEWAKPRLEGMEPPGMVINEPPLFYVARELACRQPYYDVLSQHERWDFVRAVQDILSPNHARGFSDNFDFVAAKYKLRALFRASSPEGSENDAA
jgi:hypothetical protein